MNIGLKTKKYNCCPIKNTGRLILSMHFEHEMIVIVGTDLQFPIRNHCTIQHRNLSLDWTELTLRLAVQLDTRLEILQNSRFHTFNVCCPSDHTGQRQQQDRRHLLQPARASNTITTGYPVFRVSQHKRDAYIQRCFDGTDAADEAKKRR